MGAEKSKGTYRGIFQKKNWVQEHPLHLLQPTPENDTYVSSYEILLTKCFYQKLFWLLSHGECLSKLIWFSLCHKISSCFLFCQFTVYIFPTMERVPCSNLGWHAGEVGMLSARTLCVCINLKSKQTFMSSWKSRSKKRRERFVKKSYSNAVYIFIYVCTWTIKKTK